jgi:hypothetical protein
LILQSNGAKTFDPFNVVLLRALTQVDCRVLLHSSDVDAVHLIPNLLRLKRDLRINFSTFTSLEDIALNKLSPAFPRGGLVVMDSNALIDCHPELIERMCEYMLKQRQDRATSWQLMLSTSDFTRTEQRRFESGSWGSDKLCQILSKFRQCGVVELLPETLSRREHNSTFDYHKICVALQSEHLHTYRHFLFLTNLARTHRDAVWFVESGVDVMSLNDFMRGFVGTTLLPAASATKPQQPVDDARHSSPLYCDFTLSSCTEILMNKWVLPMSTTAR